MPVKYSMASSTHIWFPPVPCFRTWAVFPTVCNWTMQFFASSPIFRFPLSRGRSWNTMHRQSMKEVSKWAIIWPSSPPSIRATISGRNGMDSLTDRENECIPEGVVAIAFVRVDSSTLSSIRLFPTSHQLGWWWFLTGGFIVGEGLLWRFNKGLPLFSG